jgi:hypothetical protein
MQDLTLPAFEMNCRDWLVVTPDEAGLPDEVAGTPLLAVLSTVVLGTDEFRPASGVLTVGLMDDDLDEALPTRALGAGCAASELLDGDDGQRRFVMPAPSGNLALVAEFSTPGGADPDVTHRIESLMTSFRWAA